jgi:mRNA interferase MazF
VWWIDFDPQRGSEQAGRRPGIIVASAFHCRLATPVTLVVPLTTRARKLDFRIRIDTPFLERTSYAITEQITTIDCERLIGKKPLGLLDDNHIHLLKAAITRMIA